VVFGLPAKFLNMKLSFSLIILFAFLQLIVSGQSNFENAVEQFLKKPEYKNASVGMHIIDLSSGETIYELKPEKVLIPASTLKLVTSASAFEMLGEDYRFETKVGYSGKIGNGELNGDLVIIGGADPALGSEYFQDHYINFIQTWVRKIKETGIEKVKGNLILDGSVFDTERIPSSWIWEDIGNYYGAGPNAFTVYDNLFRITFSSPRKVGKATKIIGIYPKIDGMKIGNNVISADNNRDNAYVYGSPLDKIRTVRGTIPRNRKAFTIKAAIHQPEEVLAKEFLECLAKEGVFITGNVLFEQAKRNDLNIVFTQESPSLSEITEVLNHESVNLFAEHFLKQISVVKNGVGDREDAIELVKGFWNSKGISTEYLFMEDGSGLSHFNAVSPKFFTQILNYMAKNEPFVNSLPGAGEGTLIGFDENLLPDKTLQSKSGSMTRVRCYAGYIQLNSGNKLAFSVMINHFSGSHSALIMEIEKLFVELSGTGT
jgi:D-alanyl-D-alanine carboxypeptidase/D-alanyl-D-alanine-endopeptidase (penicillin-binding protein 4)